MDPCPEAPNSCRSVKVRRLNTRAKIIVSVMNVQEVCLSARLLLLALWRSLSGLQQRHSLIHDPASGLIDFSGPRYCFLIRSSAFHEPALARQRVYARLRALECLLFRLDLEPFFLRTPVLP